MLLIAQGYKCAICLEPFGDTLKTSSYRFRAVIDHNHVTDKIRGLLCSRCNLLIAKLDMPGDEYKLMNAIAYLQDGNKITRVSKDING